MRPTNASASFESVLWITAGDAMLEMVDDGAANAAMAATVPVFVTEIATLEVTVAAALSLTVTEIV